MADYSQGKIYKLFIEGIEDFCYIGSTTSTLSDRLIKHKSGAQSKLTTKTAATAMFQDGNQPTIELIENFPCATKWELELRERYWLDKFPDAINVNTPTQTWQERWAKNRDRNLAKHKEWVEANQEHIASYNEAYKPIKKEKAKERYSEGYGAVRNARKKEQVECPECKKIMNKGSLWTHKNSVHK
jgi:hypothetical protein